MRENSAIISEMQRKIDALYSKPPVVPPSLDDFRDEVSATLEAQMRQDLQTALEELRRGVVDHFGAQQSHLTQQVWRKLQPAMQIVQSAHHFTDIEKCRASDIQLLACRELILVWCLLMESCIILGIPWTSS